MERTDYLTILDAMERLPFPMGRKALIAFLTGDKTHETVQRNRLARERTFGCLSGLSADEAEQLLSWMSANGLVEQVRPEGKHFRILAISARGRSELRAPKLDTQREMRFAATPPSDEERKMFSAFGFFLAPYNDEQRQAIVSRAKSLLCVAGAGSGKTTVLTKRIEFLVRFRGVAPEKVLAITFTRKAREEMQRRLAGLVQVETFNSFCERLLSRHGGILYGRSVRVLSYKDRIRLVHHAVRTLGLDMGAVVTTYFTERQRREKTREQLAHLFMNDCFSILDHYANNGEDLADFSSASPEAGMVHAVCASIREEMRAAGLRDYGDQLRDALSLLRSHPGLMPRYEHILVDEYQDVNTVQKQLLDLLAPANLFVVGDPRQSIFGWRGSRISFILDFARERPGCETVVLARNYRSGRQIVSLINAGVARMALPDLVGEREGGIARLHTFRSEDDEIAFIAQRILASTVPREEIFVLTRTNRQLQDVARTLGARGIAHVLRSDETRLVEAGEGEVTLSTVHAIKGLEARVVFVAFCTTQSFPCIASDHPVLDLVKRETGDREEEELRLFYVAMSRAKDELHLTCSGTPTRFISREMRKLLGAAYDEPLVSAQRGVGEFGDLFSRLKEWRLSASRRLGLPAYMILPDKTLLELAQQQPADIGALHDIKGIGPTKAERFGDEILGVIQSR